MNRTQKKCLIATAGFHLLLVVILVFGSAFFVSHSKEDDTQILTILPDVVSDGPSSGVKNPTPPPANPNPPQQPQPQPAPPKQVVTPPQPQPKPEPVKQPDPEPVKQPEKLTTADLTTVKNNDTPKPAKPKDHVVTPNLLPITHVVPKTNPDADAEAKRQARLANERRQKAFADALNTISSKASSATDVEMPGDSTVSFANYAAYVKAKYDAAWDPSNDISDDDSVVTVSVTISSDGTVTDSHIVTSSGDSRLDASVKKALNRVTFVHEFPEGAKEKEKTFKINFNLKAKRMLG